MNYYICVTMADSNWKHADAKNYVAKLTAKFGKPDHLIPGHLAIWHKKIGRMKTHMVKDERIPHSFPMPHHDFLYSTMDIIVSKEKLKLLADATESIFVDRLKNEVTARCAELTKNAISLGFVEAVVAGRIKPEDIRDEYARRIKNNITPTWFTDPLNEAGPNKNVKKALAHSVMPKKS